MPKKTEGAKPAHWTKGSGEILEVTLKRTRDNQRQNELVQYQRNLSNRPPLKEDRPFSQTHAQFAWLNIDCVNAESFLHTTKRRENPLIKRYHTFISLSWFWSQGLYCNL
jgi:hypothetical protein